MKYLYNKIYEAINTGIQNALALNDEDVSIIYQHKKISNDFNIDKLLQERQDEYKKLIENKNFQGCLNLYNSEYLYFEKRTVGYKVSSKEELKKIVKKFDNEKWYNFDLNWLDVSEITDMSHLFYKFYCFNCDISEWDVSNVTNMQYMFNNCYNFNSDLSQWDVSKVEDMYSMFEYCNEFNSDLSQWNVSNVKDIAFMFYSCKNFNQDLSQWNVSKVKNIAFMFYKCENFNQDLSQWNVSKVEDMQHMFYMCPIKEEYKPKFNK
ncbi:MAG: hypothetical protein [Wendovervirus sonii]|uniref:BspA family leucine-rich repeat surface protein n=1 Tax=phage Lak_Megaphage_Sonny TaxID=3109229 RepID=A0ABZ0Z660_9CAUD|nr:MAG: hypothetical protein [phage Lak_Megaphage_Sonny]